MNCIQVHIADDALTYNIREDAWINPILVGYHTQSCKAVLRCISEAKFAVTTFADCKIESKIRDVDQAGHWM